MSDFRERMRAVRLPAGKVWHKAPTDYWTRCGFVIRRDRGTYWTIGTELVAAAEPKCRRCFRR